MLRYCCFSIVFFLCMCVFNCIVYMCVSVQLFSLRFNIKLIAILYFR